MSPKKTLDILQGLYQRGIVSYPRSDSRHVTPGEAEGFPAILKKLQVIPDYQTLFPLPVESIKNNKRYVNEKKVTDHYAIIPTEQVPNLNRLSGEELKLYDLLVRTLIAAHYSPYIAEYTTIKTVVDSRAEFISKGKVQLDEGWRKVLPQKDADKEPELPAVQQGETGMVIHTEAKESKTQPPKRLTEGQLITLMKTAGKHIEDKQLEKVLMKAEGLGTEATRAGIITMLKDRAYIEVRKNLVYATAKAKILVTAVGGQVLASPEMTAKWEKRLHEIGEGEASPKQFIEQTSKMIKHLVSETTEGSAGWTFSEELTNAFVPGKIGGKSRRVTNLGKCKKCEGTVLDKGTFYGCSNYQKTKCNFTLSKQVLGKTVTQKNIKKLLAEGSTDVIEGFQSKDRTFNAKLYWDAQEKKLKFELAHQAVNQRE